MKRNSWMNVSKAPILGLFTLCLVFGCDETTDEAGRSDIGRAADDGSAADGEPHHDGARPGESRDVGVLDSVRRTWMRTRAPTLRLGGQMPG